LLFPFSRQQSLFFCRNQNEANEPQINTLKRKLIDANIEVSDKVFNTKTSGRGTAYNHKIRQVYYTLCSIGSVLARILEGQGSKLKRGNFMQPLKFNLK
jgi:hypothetical protein